MKKNIIYLFAIITLLFGCKKNDEYIFDQSPDERVNKVLDDLQAKLANAPNGWKAVLTSAVNVDYNFYFDFNKENRVKMISDFTKESSTNLMESSYRLKAMQQPALIFDTYSYLHIIADPDPNVNGGTAGQGLNSDFEFAYSPTNNTAKGDSLFFTGRFKGSKLVLVPATAAEETSILGGGYAKSWDFHTISAYNTYRYGGQTYSWNIGGKIFTYFKRFTLGSTTYDINESTFDPFAKKITISWLDAGVVKSATSAYSFGLNAVNFKTPLVLNGVTLNSLGNFVWSDANTSLTANVNAGTQTITIAGAAAPLLNNPNLPAEFRNNSINQDTYYESDYGFFRDGVYNAFGIDQLTITNGRYYNMIYWAEYGSNYDLVAPLFVVNGALNLAFGFAGINNNAANPIVKNGMLSLAASGTIGTNPTTASWQNTMTLLRAAGGHYIVKKNSTNYDMVSADGRSWISWSLD